MAPSILKLREYDAETETKKEMNKEARQLIY
jgi:hypothetical protein